MSKEIQKEDYVTCIEGYDNLKKRYFKYGPLKVVDVVENDLPYTGGKFVYCDWLGDVVGFYIDALKKW